MRPKGSADLIAYRRKRALALFDEGKSLNEVARLVACDPSSVMRWRDKRQKHGDKVFEVRFSPGRPSKLSPKQQKSLLKSLIKGAMALGYRTDLWTLPRIAEVIKKRFGVKYHPDHLGKLMTQFGWSHQKPDRRAIERDEKRIEEWKQKDWPRIKKTPKGWVPTLSS